MSKLVLDDNVQLLPEKAMYLPEEQTLVIADLHFGKVNHFRRAGLPVPQAANQRNAEALIDLINKVKPVATIFLGDLFHSTYNSEWEVVGQIVRHFPACRFRLVRGNHDIMSERQYKRQGIVVHESERIGTFLFTHEPIDASEIAKGMFNIAGHIHPGAHLQGRGRQGITLPCFWISKRQMILPAFGSFTGLALIRPLSSDQVFVILENKLMEVTAPSKTGHSKTA
jgi:DNA ligase-associated metallophosphoesterase